ncbi:MAG: cation diffusion facilitator family transporter [Spirochaetes bacterium]|nr:cation diffusion facilitator family transporter [Spirochaetota bacterium]
MADKPKHLAYIAGVLSLIINIFLFAVKYYIGSRIDSIAMQADAWHTLSDTLTSIVFLVGFWFSNKKADKEHPFGHGRAEPIAAIVIGTLLAVVGAGFFNESIIRLKSFQMVHYTRMAILIFSVSVLIKEAMALFSFWVSKKINSQALHADAWHHRSDAITTVIIVAGALVGKYILWIDSIMGIAVSLFIIYTAYTILKENISSLLGKGQDALFEKNLRKLIKEITPVASTVHHCHLHQYGDHIELTCHIKFPGNMEITEVHDIVTKIEKKIQKKMNITATIHMEPFEKKIKAG